MSESQTIEYNLTVNTDMTFSELRKLEISLIRCLNLAQRFTGDENLKNGLATMQKALMMLRSLQVAYRAVQIARMSAGDPLAWFSAATTVAATSMSMYDAITGV